MDFHNFVPDTEIDFYWANGPEWCNRLSDTPIYAEAITQASEKLVGRHSF